MLTKQGESKIKSTLFLSVLVAWAATVQRFGDAAEPLDFVADAKFFQLPDSIQLGACSAVAVDSQQNIYLFHRGKQPIICLDVNGEFLRAWGDDIIGVAHGLRIDRDDNVWVTDIGDHRVLKFSPTGKLLLALGKAGQSGDGVDEFDKPTDVAFGPDGEVYVSDGYGNNRIMKFTPNGGFLAQWGEAGKRPGQFHLPHTVVVDPTGRVLVGDRENDRIQVFESSGKLVAVWPGFAPFGLVYDKQGQLFVADGRANRLLQVDNQGKVVKTWGQEGTKPGQFRMPHMLAADAGGNLYVGEIEGERFQKLLRKN